MFVKQLFYLSATVLVRQSVLLIVVIIMAACANTLPQPIPGTASTIATSWIQAEDAAQILGNQWRLREAVHRQQPLPFDSLAPAYITFDETHLAFHPKHCNFFRAALIPDGLRHYKWGESLSTAMSCSSQETAEIDALYTAFSATTTYVLNQNQLILTGPDVQIVLIVDNTPQPPSPIPTPTPSPASYPASP